MDLIGLKHMIPMTAEAAALATLEHLRRWYGVDLTAWNAFHVRRVQPDFRIFGTLPPEAFLAMWQLRFLARRGPLG